MLQSSNKNKQTLNCLIEHLEEEEFKVKLENYIIPCSAILVSLEICITVIKDTNKQPLNYPVEHLEEQELKVKHPNSISVFRSLFHLQHTPAHEKSSSCPCAITLLILTIHHLVGDASDVRVDGEPPLNEFSYELFPK